jgi:hypothetical protein
MKNNKKVKLKIINNQVGEKTFLYGTLYFKIFINSFIIHSIKYFFKVIK